MNNVTPVSSVNPTRIIPAALGSRHVVRNLSAGTIYLDSITVITPLSFPLLAGEGCIWQDNKGCVALAAPGNNNAQVAISDSLESPLGLGTVGVTGTKTGQTVLSGATQNAVSVATNSSNIALTTTVIPGGSQSIELHNCVFQTAGAGGTGPNVGKLIRSDTGANLAIPQSVVVAGGVASQAKDFQGVLLPPGVAVQSVTTTPAFGQSSTVSVDINYNLVG